MAFENYIGSCDRCPARCAETYDQFPGCRECGDAICPNCAHPGSEIAADGAPDAHPDQNTVVCKRCTLAEGPCESTFDGFHNGAPGDYCKACGYGLPDEDPRTAEEARDEATFAETHGGEL